MELLQDMKTMIQLALPKRHRSHHSDRLESFYASQSSSYDTYRDKLLHGRERLMRSLPIPQGGCLLDMGGGTGRNIEWLGERVNTLSHISVVDLCPSLLRIADRRIGYNKWSNVSTKLADVTSYQPADGPVDAVTFSYSLTMIPNWFDAIDNAYSLLKPGGFIGVLDFYVSDKWPDEQLERHRSFGRHFWPMWFGYNNIFLNPDHLTYLRRKFVMNRLDERRAPVPYLPGLKVPYYLFIGRKSEN